MPGEASRSMGESIYKQIAKVGAIGHCVWDEVLDVKNRRSHKPLT